MPIRAMADKLKEKVEAEAEEKAKKEKVTELASAQQSKTLFVFSEGPVAELGQDLTKVFLNDTPIRNADGSYNFYESDIKLDARQGTLTQSVMPDFMASEKEVPVGVELKYNHNVVRTVTDPNVNKIRVTLGVKGLYEQLETGGTVFHYVYFHIQVGKDIRTVKISGKTREQYLQQIEFTDLPPAPFNIQVSRFTENSTSLRIQDESFWSSYTEIITSGLRYPHTALFGLTLNSKSFSSFPRLNVLMKGILVNIPSNYNPYSRTYSGMWDGTFKRSWTNNPAFIFYDLMMNERYGLGKRMGVFGCDKWALYAIAQYCDQVVPDGFGGTEPRFTCNVAIQNQRQAYELIQDLASVFRGMPIWNGLQMTAVQDRLAEPVCVYTNANVIDGEFNYSSAGMKARHNALHVEYLDKKDHYRKKQEYVGDDEMINRYGLNVKKVVAFGCTSRGQARRTGLWILETEKRERQTVTFSVGLEGLKHLPSDIIEVADEHYAGVKVGGRILAINGRVLTLDREIDPVPNGFLRVLSQQGEMISARISQVDGKQVTLEKAITLDVMQIWSYHGEIKPRLFRAIAIEEKEGVFTITALQHEPQKEAVVDNGAHFERVETTKHRISKLTYLNIESKAGGGLAINWSATQGDSQITYEVRVLKNGQLYKVYRDLTSLDLALTDLPNGDYQIIVLVIGERGQILDQKTQNFTVNRPPIPEEVEISSGLSDITLTWKLVDSFTHTEIWASLTDVRTESKLVGKILGNSFIHKVGAEQIRFYWVRHTRGENAGYFHQENGLRGETGADIDKEMEILRDKLSTPIINQIFDVAVPARGLELIKTVDTLDSPTIFQNTNLLFNLSDKKQYIWNGQEYKATIPASDIEGLIPTTQLLGQLQDNQIATLSSSKLSGTVAKSQLDPSLIGDIARTQQAIEQETRNRISALQKEANTRGNEISEVKIANAEQTRQIQTAISKAENALSGVQEERSARARDSQAVANKISTLTAKVGEHTSNINAINEAKANKNEVSTIARTALQSEWQSAIGQSQAESARVAQAKADKAKTDALAAAERTAQTKGDAAKSAAIAQASRDAKSKADAAKAQAIADAAAKDEVIKRQAAEDAQAKANQAKSEVLAEATRLNTATNARIETLQTTLTTATSSLATLNTKLTSSIGIKDTRNNNQPPSWYWQNYPNTTANEFKGMRTIGVGNSGFCSLQTIVAWGDPSGNPIIQIAIDSQGKVYRRKSDVAYTGSGRNPTYTKNTWTAWVEDETVVGAQAKADAVKRIAGDALNSANNAKAQVESMSRTVTDITGKVQALHTIKTETILGGKRAIAGLSLGSTGGTESSIILMADRTSFVKNAQDGHPKTLMTVANGKLALNGELIATGGIKASHLAADSVSTGTLQVSAVRGQHIASGEISTDKLAIGLGGNLLYNPIFSNEGYGWHTQNGTLQGFSIEREFRGHKNENWYLNTALENERLIKIRYGGNVGSTSITNKWCDILATYARVIPNKWYIFSAYMRSYRCNSILLVEEVNSETNSYIKWVANSSASGDFDGADNTGQFDKGFDKAKRFFIKFKAPASGKVRLAFRTNRFQANQRNPDCYVARPMLEECTEYSRGPSPWQNAGVTAIHGGSIVTNTITTQQLASGSVTTEKLVAGAVNTRHIAVNTINGSHVQTKSLGAEKLRVQHLSSISANLGDITGGSLSINNRFKVSRDGSVEIRNRQGNVGLVMTNDAICVYDESGHLQVKFGRLR